MDLSRLIEEVYASEEEEVRERNGKIIAAGIFSLSKSALRVIEFSNFTLRVNKI